MTSQLVTYAPPTGSIRALLVSPRQLDVALASGSRRRALELGALAFVGAALFGAALGMDAGALAVLRSSLSVPAIMLLNLVVLVPALMALLRFPAGGLDVEVSWPSIALRALAATATASVVLMGTAPLLLVALAWNAPGPCVGYLGTGCAALAGMLGARHVLPPMGEVHPLLRGGLWLVALGVVALASVHAAWVVLPR